MLSSISFDYGQSEGPSQHFGYIQRITFSRFHCTYPRQVMLVFKGFSRLGLGLVSVLPS